MDTIYEPEMFDFGLAGNLAIHITGSLSANTALFYIRSSPIFAGTPIFGAERFFESARPSMIDYDLPSYEKLLVWEGFLRVAYADFANRQKVKMRPYFEAEDGSTTPAEVSVSILEFGEDQSQSLVCVVVDLLDGSPREAIFAGSSDKSDCPDFVFAYEEGEHEEQTLLLLRDLLRKTTG